jgi:hypothetical protein
MRAATATFTVLLIEACVPDVPGEVRAEDCTDPALSEDAVFTERIRPDFFEPYCAYCHWSTRGSLQDRHGAPLYFDLDDLQETRELASLIWDRLQDGTMPPMGATPTLAERKDILAWLQCNTAPVESGDDDSAR